MARFITVINHKGGVGKTVTALHLGALFALAGKKVFLYDLDPQGWAGRTLGLESRDFGSLNTMDQDQLRKALVPTKIKNLSLLWNSSAQAQIRSASPEEFYQSLERVKLAFDYILVDLPPGNNLLHRVIPACGLLSLIPVPAHSLGLSSLESTLKTLGQSAEAFQKELKVVGVLVTRFSPESPESQQARREIRQAYPDLTFQTAIPEDPLFSATFADNRPPMISCLNSYGSYTYLDVAREILQNREFPLPSLSEEGPSTKSPSGTISGRLLSPTHLKKEQKS